MAQVAVLDPEKRLIHLRLHNERTRARFLIIFAATKNYSIVFNLNIYLLSYHECIGVYRSK